MRVLTLFLIAGLVLAVSGPAWAITLTVGYNEFKLTNQDNGTLYLGIAPGVGSSIGDPNNVANGVGILDVAARLQAVGSIGSEDSWGIARTTSILDINTDPVWSEGGATELTWMFRSAVDFYAENVDAAGNIVTTESVGLIAELYEETKLPGWKPYTTALGAAGRTTLSTYKGATEGTLLLQLTSVAGFIHTPGTLGGALTEFETTFNSLSSSGGGVAYFEVTDGTLASLFDTNTISTPASLLNGVGNADAWIEFTSTPAHTGPNPSGGKPKPGGGYYLPGAAPYDWLTASNDPLRTNVVPEPVTMASLFLGIGCLGRYIRKRR